MNLNDMGMKPSLQVIHNVERKIVLIDYQLFDPLKKMI